MIITETPAYCREVVGTFLMFKFRRLESDVLLFQERKVVSLKVCLPEKKKLAGLDL